jgi:tetratricopeptide (TPR) repeat protein
MENTNNENRWQKDLKELGLRARQEGKEEEALKYFEQLIKAYPHKVSGYVEAGKSFKALQRFEEAKARFEQALRIKPNNLEALMGFGEISALEWELESALAKFQRAIEYHPNHLKAYLQAATQLRNLQRFIEAEEIVNLGLTNFGEGQKSIPLLKEKVFCLLGQLKLDEANEILQNLAQNTRAIAIFNQAATVLIEMKKFDQAIELIDKNLSLLNDLEPNYIRVRRARKTILSAKRNYIKNLSITQKDATYQLVDLKVQKTLLHFPLEQFDSAKISIKRPTIFSDKSTNTNAVNLNKGFDDLGGLLAREKQILYNNSSFKAPIYSKTEYKILTLPNAYIHSEKDDITVFSLDGYYPAELGNKTYSIIKSQKEILNLAFIASSPFYNNYYHIVVDIIPSLLIYKKLDLNCPIVFPSISRNIQNVFTNYLGIDNKNIILQDDCNDRSFNLGIVFMKVTLDLDTITFYRDVANGVLSSKNLNFVSPNKIYISRRRTSKRPLLNEEEVEIFLLSLGFYICYMEDHSFEEQIAMMRGCEIVVAPHGAGLTNILFSNPSMTVIELLMDKYTVSHFYKMSVLCSHKYYPVLGSLKKERNWQKDQDFEKNFLWEIDLTKLQQVLDKAVN